MGRNRHPYRIFKRSGTRNYLVQFLDIDGKRHTKNSGQTTLPSAARWADSFFASQLAGQSAVTTFQQIKVPMSLRIWLGDPNVFCS